MAVFACFLNGSEKNQKAPYFTPILHPYFLFYTYFTPEISLFLFTFAAVV